MTFKRTLLLLLVIIPVIAFGQKKTLSHDDYDIWKNLGSTTLTDNGLWVSYEINPQEGDGYLYYYNVKTAGLDSVARGTNAAFAPGTEYLVYSIKPGFAETRQAKKDKKKPDEMPKNDLVIKILPAGETTLVERVKSYQIATEGEPWMAYLLEKPLPEKKDKENDGEKKEGEETPEAGQTPATAGAGRARGGAAGGRNGNGAEGTELVIANPAQSLKYSFEDVTDYKVADNGSSVAILQVKSDTTKIKTYTVSLFDTGKKSETEIFSGQGNLKSLTLDENGKNIAFLFTTDTSKVKIYSLWLSSGAAEAAMAVNCETTGMPDGWCVSENGSISFDEAGSFLLFGTAERPVEQPEDTLLDDEKSSLDVWSWHDQMLQPQQKVSLNRDLRNSYIAMFNIKTGKMVQLADEEMSSVRVPMKGERNIALGTASEKYGMMTSWDASRYADYYIVDLANGKRTMVFEKAASSVELSPAGKWLLWWSVENKEWLVKPVGGGEGRSLTGTLEPQFYNELHDSPSEPRPYGTAGWVEGEKYLLVYDRYDIWKMDVTGKENPVNLTNGFGRKNNITFRYSPLEGSGGRFRGQSDKIYIGEKETLPLSASHDYTKQSGLWNVRVNRPADPTKIDMGDYAYRSMSKAKDADIMIFQRGTYVDYPELYISKSDLSGAKKISNTNPQQEEYNWGTVELVEWRSFDGQMLQGLLYKPENFDPSKKYPMVAYFYERSSDGLHSYMAPAPSASTINRTYAVSNGYLVFVPDIPYVIGYPGQSAYNAIVSGTYAMMEQFDFIDPDRLGLDGQSWGGYQIAYLITQTDMFRCAFSGAPVSNMTSAYGGIRWGSGMSRMFQYEETQSRIGGTLWEKPIHYIENSPIFFVPKVNTPVLIMHNDEDGAVPWYQGIEFFVALRRLGKPAWMLSYNKEDHNLVRRPNRKDLSIRKMQFFDHYLMGKPMPYWMENGVTQVEKSKGVKGYELMENK